MNAADRDPPGAADRPPAGANPELPPATDPPVPDDGSMITPSPESVADFTPGMATPAGESIAPQTPMPSALIGVPRTEEPVPGKKWTRIQRLGVGGYGEVWKVRYLNSEEAWKFLPKRPGASFQAFRETFNARSINHPSVVRIQDILEEEDHFIIRMDLVRGRNLHEVVSEEGVLPPLMVCRFAVQLAGALEAAHKAGVLHLDLKPSNILLRDDGERVLITDFGISATTTKGFFQVDPKHRVGTPYFLAPEQVRAEAGEDPRFGPGVDVWALGITLYFLLARAYPFDFGSDDPSVILRDDPQPIAESVPYIGEELWSVLKRMLERDPARRYADMGQVRAAFSAYVTEITCPACHRTFPMEHVHGVCPEVNCPDPPRVVALKERRQQMRGGHHFFSRCEHARAIEAYRRVLRMEEAGEKVYSERADRLIKIAEADAKAMARRIEVIRGNAEGGDLLRAIKEVDRARTRFSAARELVELRRTVLEAIQGRYENVVGTCSKLVKETRFADAKLLLTQVEGFLGYEPVRRRLREWEEAKDRRAPPVQDLYNFVEERENFLLACQKDVARYLEKLRLDRAAACLQRLEKHFPNPERGARIRLYSDLQESLDFVQSCDPVAIEKILDADEGALPPSRVELRRAETHCGRLIEGLAEDRPEGLAEIVVRREGLSRVIGRLRDRIGALQAKAEAAERDGRLRDQQAAVEGLSAIAERTDLMDFEEVARVRALESRVSDVIRRAEEKYREGMKRFEQNDFSQAQILLEAAARIAPGLLPDIPDKITELRELQEENRAIGEQTYQVFNRIMGENATIEDFRAFVRLSQQDAARHEQETMMDIAQKGIRVFSRLFMLQGNKIGKLTAPSERLSALRETIDIVEGEPETKLAVGLVKKDSNLNERMLEFFGRILGPLERGEEAAGELDARFDHLRGVIAEMTRLRNIVKLLTPLKYHPHPAERASTALVSLRPAILEEAEPRGRLGTLLGLHDELAVLAQDEATLRQIEKHKATIKRTIRGVAFARLLHRLGRIGLRSAIPVSTALAVGVVLYFYFQAQRGQDRRELALDVIGPALRRYDLTLTDLDEDKLALAKRGNQGFAEFMNPLLVVGRSDAPTDTSTFAGISRWIEWKREEKAGLEYVAGMARDASLARVRAAIEKLGDEAAGRIRGYLAARFGEAMQAVAAGDLSADRAALHREMRDLASVVASLGTGGGATLDRVTAGVGKAAAIAAPGDGGDTPIRTAEQWARWLDRARGATLETGVPELDGPFLELLAVTHLGDAVRSLADHSRAIYWSEEAGSEYPGYLSRAVAALAAFGEHLRGSASLKGLSGRLPEKLVPAGDAVRDKVWTVVRDLLRRE